MNKVWKPVGIVTAAIVGLCLMVTAALFVISGFFLPAKYLEPWKKSYASQFGDPRMRLASAGLRAASGHNMQPWKIQLDPNPKVFYLYADSSRLTPQVDPDARQFMISQGTFLGYVEVAGRQLGWHTDIELFPLGVYDEANLTHSMDVLPVARVTLTRATPQDDPLYDGIYLPDTNRGPYLPDKLTANQVKMLEAVQTQNGASVTVYQDTTNLSTLRSYAMKSAKIEAGVSRVMQETNAIFRPNEYQKNKYRSGFSVEGQGTTGFMKNILQGLVTVIPSFNTGKGASENFINSTQTSVEHTPAYAMIVTPDNTRSTQVESGILYSRLVLTGHHLGLAMQPLSQALEEYPEMKEPYDGLQQAYAPGGTIQMLFRVGKATEDVPLSMRRDVKDLIMK